MAACYMMRFAMILSMVRIVQIGLELTPAQEKLLYLKWKMESHPLTLFPETPGRLRPSNVSNATKNGSKNAAIIATAGGAPHTAAGPSHSGAPAPPSQPVASHPPAGGTQTVADTAKTTVAHAGETTVAHAGETTAAHSETTTVKHDGEGAAEHAETTTVKHDEEGAAAAERLRRNDPAPAGAASPATPSPTGAAAPPAKPSVTHPATTHPLTTAAPTLTTTLAAAERRRFRRDDEVPPPDESHSETTAPPPETTAPPPETTASHSETTASHSGEASHSVAAASHTAADGTASAAGASAVGPAGHVINRTTNISTNRTNNFSNITIRPIKSKVGANKTMEELKNPKVKSVLLQLAAKKFHDCPELLKNDVVDDRYNNPSFEDKAKWTAGQRVMIEMMFIIGYISGQMAGGFAGQIVGGKLIFTVGLVLSAVFTMVLGAMATGSATIIYVLKLFIGVAQGLAYGALHVIVAYWIPTEDLTMLGAAIFGSGLLGVGFLGIVAMGLLGSSFSVGPVFFIAGGLTLVFAILFFLATVSSPDDHPNLTGDEQALLSNHIAGLKNVTSYVPFGAAFGSTPFWAITIASIGHHMGLYTYIVILPFYYYGVLLMTVKKACLMMALGYIFGGISAILAGFILHSLVQKEVTNTKNARKIGALVASIGPSLGLIVFAAAKCSDGLDSAMAIIGLICIGFYYPSVKVNIFEITPNFAGVLGPISNGIGNLGGLLVLIILNVTMEPMVKVSHFSPIFYMTVALMIITHVIFAVMSTTDVQPWNEQFSA